MGSGRLIKRQVKFPEGWGRYVDEALTERDLDMDEKN